MTTLASELLSLSCENAHDAKVDVELLEKLVLKFLNAPDLVSIVHTISQIIKEIETNNTKKILQPSFAPMKKSISANAITNLAKAGISYSDLIKCYKNRGLQETEELLQRKVNGVPTLVKKKALLDKITAFLKEAINCIA